MFGYLLGTGDLDLVTCCCRRAGTPRVGGAVPFDVWLGCEPRLQFSLVEIGTVDKADGKW